MAKNTTILTLLQNFISQEEVAGILAEFGFEDTARKCDVPTLLKYLVGGCGAAFEWKSLRHAADVASSPGLKNDGPIGVQLEDKRFILVANRAYFSIDKADRYAQKEQDFVIRLKENIHLNCKKPLKRAAVTGSHVVADFTCIIGMTQKQTKKRYRVVEFVDYEGELYQIDIG